ncbi:hypothetical protein B5P46_11860 [Rhizobium leguminosarum]|uniref:Uncharacterized protein n=1 Tax=Rhizobium leguminosarum TaxID=384 RepID=A0A4V1P308_RHILE|nr:hypothetical protein [Rhizobium leguminosarum]RXT29370.1 hypothetical protein B5P46_11860 [Rhizobium leguminosarum]
METVIGLFAGGLGGGAAAGAGAAATGAAAAGAAATGAAAAGGISFATILQGGLGLLSAVTAINGANAQADSLELQAQDAAREQPLETLQGIARRASIKRDYMDAVGKQDAAYAASGTDLSFGTPSVARSEAFREADLALETDNGTQQTRQARLQEREANYLKMSRKARQGGIFDAISTIGGTALKIADRY